MKNCNTNEWQGHNLIVLRKLPDVLGTALADGTAKNKQLVALTAYMYHTECL